MPLTSALYDEFTGVSLDAQWSGSYGDIIVGGGVAQIPCGHSGGSPLYAGMQSAATYELDDVWCELVPAPAAGATGQAYTALAILSGTGGTSIHLRVDTVAETLRCESNTGYFDGAATEIAYDGTDHRWVRVTRTGGNVLWRTSPDGLDWTTRRTLAEPAWTTGTTLAVLVECSRDSGTSNYATVDNVGVEVHTTVGTGAATASASAVSAALRPLGLIIDDFDDDSRDTDLWSGSYGGITETGGRARVDCDVAQYSGYGTARVYTLAGSSVTVRMWPPAAGGGTDTAYASMLVLSSTGGTDAGVLIDMVSSGFGAYIGFLSRTGYADGAATYLEYNATDHAWVRMSESGGTLTWETSPDSIVWTVRRTASSPAWVSDLDLGLLLESHRGSGADDYAEFDGLNAGTASTAGAGTAVAGATATVSTTRAAASTGGAVAAATASTTAVRTTVGTGAVSADATASASSARTTSTTGPVVASATTAVATARTITAAGPATAHGAAITGASKATAGAGTVTASAVATAGTARTTAGIGAATATGAASTAGLRITAGTGAAVASATAVLVVQRHPGVHVAATSRSALTAATARPVLAATTSRG